MKSEFPVSISFNRSDSHMSSCLINKINLLVQLPLWHRLMYGSAIRLYESPRSPIKSGLTWAIKSGLGTAARQLLYFLTKICVRQRTLQVWWSEWHSDSQDIFSVVVKINGAEIPISTKKIHHYTLIIFQIRADDGLHADSCVNRTEQMTEKSIHQIMFLVHEPKIHGHWCHPWPRHSLLMNDDGSLPI